MSPHDVMSSKKASYDLGMSPIKGQEVSGRMKYVNFMGRFSGILTNRSYKSQKRGESYQINNTYSLTEY